MCIISKQLKRQQSQQELSPFYIAKQIQPITFTFLRKKIASPLKKEDLIPLLVLC